VFDPPPHGDHRGAFVIKQKSATGVERDVSLIEQLYRLDNSATFWDQAVSLDEWCFY